ncbi:YigZ family protein [Francisella halioticida]|uniref:YigZ family protein n=1 Tax=Francisella halioticida TaxID=549298 RepID=A0ABM6M0V1_9GAMM|nr:YigZ family protein [Francisella halioticida]ASG68591.1 YigZ family protein [Francisella halioticida]
MNVYKTISKNIQTEVEPIKKSRLIAYAFYIESEQEALDEIGTIKARYGDVNHHCWAYALTKDNRFRFSDDGEPNGSAGKPILSHIQGNDLLNVLVIVVRYFGGTKLGVGGLIRAYGQAAKDVLELADIVSVETNCCIQIIYGYNETASIDIVLKHYNVNILSQEYSEMVQLVVQENTSDKLSFIEELKNVTKGKVQFRVFEEN